MSKIQNQIINQNIADEFSTSLINKYHVEHHDLDDNETGFNQAEIEAMREERKRYEDEIQKRAKYGYNMQKYKDNIRKYKTKQSDIIKKEKENAAPKINKAQRTKEYNEKIRQMQKLKAITKDSPIKKVPKPEPEVQQTEILDTFSFKNTTGNNETENDLKYGRRQSLGGSINNSMEKPNCPNNEPIVQDMRDHIMTQLQSEITLTNTSSSIPVPSENININEQIEKNLERIKNFRQNGFAGLFNNTNQAQDL